MESLPIEYKFESERFQRFLHAHPHQAHEYAVSHFEDYLAILHEYRLLQAKHDQLQKGVVKSRWLTAIARRAVAEPIAT